MELAYKVGEFAVGKGGDGISEVGVGAGERLGRDVDGTSFAREGSTCGGGGLERRIWWTLGGLQKWTVGCILRKLRLAGSEERMWKPSRSLPMLLPPNTIMVTVDVTSLYTNIPHSHGLSALEHFLNQCPAYSLATT